MKLITLQEAIDQGLIVQPGQDEEDRKMPYRRITQWMGRCHESIWLSMVKDCPDAIVVESNRGKALTWAVYRPNQSVKLQYDKYLSKALALICILFLPLVASADFLSTLALVESGNNTHAIGDGGRARGLYQFRAVAWRQVNTLRSRRGLPHLSYSHSTNQAVAREFAVEYLRWLSSTFTTARKRSPTTPELYALWNLGPTGFARRGFSLAKCPATTRRAAERFE